MQRKILSVIGFLLLVIWSMSTTAEVRRFDTDGDGMIDQWEYYTGTRLFRLEADRNHDGRVDQWITYRRGQPEKAEFDSNGDGKIEQREFYDEQGELKSVEADRDGDGILDNDSSDDQPSSQDRG